MFLVKARNYSHSVSLHPGVYKCVPLAQNCQGTPHLLALMQWGVSSNLVAETEIRLCLGGVIHFFMKSLRQA